MPDVAELTLGGAGELLASGAVSSRELTEAVLRRIDETEPLVHAYAHVMSEQALAAAVRADKQRAAGELRGPLHGLPFAVKDVFCTHDAPTEAGSRLLRGFVAPQDAAAVDALRRGGAVLVGKLVTHEFCCGQDVPATRNAWNPADYPGGSSAGAGVAVAVGSTLAALGTDAGGSVRKPASLNGVVGLKPTYGLVSMDGVFAVAPSLDHVGTVTRTVDDCRLVLAALAGPVDVEQGQLQGARVGVAREFFGDELEPDVQPVVSEALAELERLGATLVSVGIPALELTLPAGLTILVAEAAAVHHQGLRETPDGYVPETRLMLELGALLPAAYIERAQRARALLCREVADAFGNERIDALVTPTLPRASMAVEDMVIETDLPKYIPYTLPANLTGLPALSVPCGFTAAGLPVGLQLIGRRNTEATLLGIAGQYEQATPWHERRPELATI
jgi:Asp-tRNA(Asn)/Glu-tRNA(Gln) amidotransferase A subunit family amidase